MKPTIIHSSKVEKRDFGRKKVRDIINQKDWPFSIAIVEKTDKTKIGYAKKTEVFWHHENAKCFP